MLMLTHLNEVIAHKGLNPVSNIIKDCINMISITKLLNSGTTCVIVDIQMYFYSQCYFML